VYPIRGTEGVTVRGALDIPGVMGVALAGVPRHITIPAKKQVSIIFAEFI
jgi:hypothetical protein